MTTQKSNRSVIRGNLHPLIERVLQNIALVRDFRISDCIYTKLKNSKDFGSFNEYLDAYAAIDDLTSSEREILKEVREGVSAFDSASKESDSSGIDVDNFNKMRNLAPAFKELLYLVS